MNESTGTSFIGIVFLLVMVCLTFTLPRKRAWMPLLITVFFIPLGQSIAIFGINLFFFRILLLAGIMRALWRGEFQRLQVIGVDKFFLCWGIIMVGFGTLSEPSISLLINRTGLVFNTLGAYLFFRCVIKDRQDVLASIRVIMILSVPVAAIMVSERVTGRNPLAFLGGVLEWSAVRDGEVRAQAAFRHPILAGTAGAWLFVLAIGMWNIQRKQRMVPLLAAFSGLIMVVSANTSGALISWLAGIGGLILWRFRAYMKAVLWGGFLGLCLLALVMKAPIWYLSAKIANLTGGSGYHRAFIIDQSINYFHEWWLFGTQYTAHWAPHRNTFNPATGGMDVANQYLAEGLSGGVFTLLLFLALIIVTFRLIGKIMAVYRDEGGTDVFLVWCLGVILFVHSVAFLSVTYFDQSIVFWCWLLGSVGSLANERRPKLRERARGSFSTLGEEKKVFSVAGWA